MLQEMKRCRFLDQQRGVCRLASSGNVAAIRHKPKPEIALTCRGRQDSC
jgi:hypothetical protein